MALIIFDTTKNINMQRSIVFATGNPNKIREVKEILDSGINIVGLKEIGCLEDIPETSPTIEGNALQKAQYVVERYGIDCFSEDTGLEIAALNGAPGVLTARYAGAAKDPEANMALVLQQLKHQANRAAQFKTVVALIFNGQKHLFEGIVKGTISEDYLRGDYGFGYDPIFVPNGFDKSFAQMTPNEKNAISHRGKAINKLKLYLNNLVNQG